MLRSARFWIAAVLVVTALICTIKKPALLPAPSSSNVQHQTVEAPHKGSADQTASETVSVSDTAAVSETTATELKEYAASVPVISEHKKTELVERIDILSEECKDFIGWIYIADSDIDYPIVQGTDNQYYLHHAPDGSENESGSIFLDYQCACDFSDKQNILYGHNMQSGMFGDIRSFKEREKYDSHRYGWIFMNGCRYRIVFYALAIVNAYDPMFDIPTDGAKWQKWIKDNSMYYTEGIVSDDDVCVALYTCASDFENARALFVGKLEKML